MIVEGPFGIGKNYHLLGKSLFRSGGMTHIQVLICACVHNLCKISRYVKFAGSGSGVDIISTSGSSSSSVNGQLSFFLASQAIPGYAPGLSLNYNHI